MQLGALVLMLMLGDVMATVGLDASNCSLSNCKVKEDKEVSHSSKPLGEVRQEAHHLSSIFARLAKDEMGTAVLQRAIDNFPTALKKPLEDEEINKLAVSIYNKIKSFRMVLQSIKQLVENLYKFHVKDYPITFARDCCFVNNVDFSFFGPRQILLNPRNNCEILPAHLPKNSFNPGRNLNSLLKSTFSYCKIIKWGYFISTNGVQSIYPSYNFGGPGKCHEHSDMLHRQAYVRTVDQLPKHVLLLVDHGRSLSREKMLIAKALSKTILNSLSDTDQVGVLAVGETVSFSPDGGRECVRNSLVPATQEARALFTDFVDSLSVEKKRTNHSLGFEIAFRILENTIFKAKQRNKSISDRVMIIFISSGGVEQLHEPKQVIETIYRWNTKLRNVVRINSCVLSDGRPIVWAKTFMRNVAKLNYEQYGLVPPHEIRLPGTNELPPVKRGVSLLINRSSELAQHVDELLGLKHGTPAVDDVLFSMPYKDPVDNGLIVSVTTACEHTLPQSEGSGTMVSKGLIGMIGLDIAVAELAQSVIYYQYSKEGTSYAFLLHESGNVIFHPKFGRPAKMDFSPMHVHITHLENYHNFDELLVKILSTNESGETLSVVTSGAEPHQRLFEARYVWRRVPNSPFVVVIKWLTENTEFTMLAPAAVPTRDQVTYHRIDLSPPPGSLCSHFLHPATASTSVVYLSPSAFQKSLEHIQRPETKRVIDEYSMYLSDHTKLVQSSAFKAPVRCSVALLTFLNNHWLSRMTSLLSPYIIRRYAATPTGVLRMHPGTPLHSDYDPTYSDWYRKAAAKPGHLIISAPRKDAISGEYVVTFSEALVRTSDKTKRVAAVLAMDVTLGYLYHQLLDLMPVCKHDLSCFLMDEGGFLVAHRSLVNTTEQLAAKRDLKAAGGDGRDTVEWQHITTKESLVAFELLSHREFVIKKQCHSYLDRTSHRWYQFNTSIDYVVTNLLHREHSAKYQIAAINHTNLFFGMVDHASSSKAFCPCNTKSRMCMNCERMKQTECECPCECSLLTDLCAGGVLSEQEFLDTQPCQPLSEVPLPLTPARGTNGCLLKQQHLPDCFPSHCSAFTTWRDCFAVQGCSWCEYKSDERSPLEKPFCSSNLRCLGGVLKSQPPTCAYKFDDARVRAEEGSVQSAPVGPVAGGLLGCVLVLGLAVYCYRQRVHRERQDVLAQARSLQPQGQTEELVPEAGPSHADGHGNINQSIVLATFDNPAHISPYRVSIDYRRPVIHTGADSSDPGYSTMKDDSDRASLPQDPLSDRSEAGSVPGGPRLRQRMRYELGPFFRPAPSKGGACKIPRIPPPPSSVSSRSSRRSRSPSPPREVLVDCPQSPLRATPIPEGQTLLCPPKTKVPVSVHRHDVS